MTLPNFSPFGGSQLICYKYHHSSQGSKNPKLLESQNSSPLKTLMLLYNRQHSLNAIVGDPSHRVLFGLHVRGTRQRCCSFLYEADGSNSSDPPSTPSETTIGIHRPLPLQDRDTVAQYRGKVPSTTTHRRLRSSIS